MNSKFEIQRSGARLLNQFEKRAPRVWERVALERPERQIWNVLQSAKNRGLRNHEQIFSGKVNSLIARTNAGCSFSGQAPMGRVQIVGCERQTSKRLKKGDRHVFFGIIACPLYYQPI
jgi:hypothetical protein